MKKILVVFSMVIIMLSNFANCLATSMPQNFTIHHGYVFDGSFEEIPKGTGFYSIGLEDGSAIWTSNVWDIKVDTSVDIVMYNNIIVFIHTSNENYFEECKNVEYNGVKYEKEIFDFILKTY